MEFGVTDVNSRIGTAQVRPIVRVEVIPLVVPEVDRSDLDGLSGSLIAKVHDEAGRFGFGETDAPPDVVKSFITTPTAVSVGCGKQ